MVDYETSTMLKEQLDDLTAKTNELYETWMYLENKSEQVKNTFSQAKLLVRLSKKLSSGNYSEKQVRKIGKRMENLDRRIDERFEIEYPAKTIEILKVHNAYLLSKSQLNGLRSAYDAYYRAVVDE